jgi:hypothetical protein
MALSARHKYALSSVFFLVIAVVAYFSPDHLCPYFVHIPWLASTCPYNDATPFVAKWGSKPSKTRKPAVDLTSLPTISLTDLKKHDGTFDGIPLRLAIDGIVLDVDTPEGRRFYAVGQSYHLFAGGDYTRALALGSLEEADVARKDDVSGFDASQRKDLADRVQFYLDKYEPVAVLDRDTPRFQS